MIKPSTLCRLLGIEHPVLQGGMLWLADAILAAAVSNAGALGVVSPLAGIEAGEEPAENFAKQIKTVKQLTQNPFGVNLPLDLPYIGNLVDVALKEEVGIVVTAAGNPADYSALFKSRGGLLLHVVSNVRQALNAEACGADAIIAEGVEAAAHIGADELPLFSLIPQVVDAVSVPVVAAGGIVDSRGMVAALALGAQGIQMGTRFVAVQENLAHPDYKNAILSARDTDTLVTGREYIPTRSLKTEFSRRLMALEQSGAGPRDLNSFIGYRSNHQAQVMGKLAHGEAYCGASAGLIKELLPAAAVVRQVVQGYRAILDKLS